jgi:hypothetical protein
MKVVTLDAGSVLPANRSTLALQLRGIAYVNTFTLAPTVTVLD